MMKKQVVSNLSAVEVKSIFILRPDNLGDLVLFSGALCHLRNYYPNAKITLCIQRYVANYIELCPFIDKIVYWEDLVPNIVTSLKKDLKSQSLLKNLLIRFYLKYSPLSLNKKFYSLLNYNKLASKLANYRTDLLLMPIVSPNSWTHSIAKLIPAKVKYGIIGNLHNISLAENRLSKAIYDFSLDLSNQTQLNLELITNQQFLALLGINVDKSQLWPEVWTDANDRDWALAKVNSQAAVTLAICPGGNSFEGKNYPVDRYNEIISSIPEKQFSIIILGSSDELALGQKLATNLAKCSNIVAINNLTGLTTVRQLIEVLRLSNLILSPDNGAMHLGITLGKQTTSIVGGGVFNRYYPWGDPLLNRFAYKLMDCYGCQWRCCHLTIKCITELSPNMIANEIRILLNKKP